MKNLVLAIIAPCYNEEEILETSFNKLNVILEKLKSKKTVSNDSYISFIDDGSTDKSWEIIKNLGVKGIKLSRNFGHQAAILAGLKENSADIYITLDVDLQDDINLIEQMIYKYNEGFEIVYGVRNNRSNDAFIKRCITDFYYKSTRFFKMDTIPNHGDFRLLSDKVVNILRKNTESNLYLRGIIPYLGFRSTNLYYKRQKRIGGSAKYNYFKLIGLALNGITSFSVVPLRLISFLGLISFVIAIVMTVFSLVAFFTTKIITGWTSLFISIYFLGGIQLLSIGIIGEYIGKIYYETKQRPHYIIEEKFNAE